MSDSPDANVSVETTAADLTLAIGMIFRRLRQEASAGGLSLSQVAALARLETAGSMTIADLARADAVKPQSMGATIAYLEQEGLVQRRPHPTDGRQVLFALTDAGVAARRERTLAKREWLETAMARLDPGERQTLISAAALIKRLAET